MLSVVVAACARSHGPTVAVLPERWATVRPATAISAAPRVGDVLRSHAVRSIDEARAAGVIAREPEACQDDLECLQRVGTELGARKLVTLRLAELGDTVAVHVTLVDAARGAREATMREIVSPHEPGRFAATLDVLGERLARQTAPGSSSGRTWLWIGAGGVVVAAVATAIALSRSPEATQPDTTIVPP